MVIPSPPSSMHSPRVDSLSPLDIMSETFKDSMVLSHEPRSGAPRSPRPLPPLPVEIEEKVKPEPSAPMDHYNFNDEEKEFVVVKHTYVPKRSDELRLEKDDVIQVLQKESANGWWKGEVRFYGP